MTINCIKCKNPIPNGRLEILPNTKVCVQCSDVSTYKGISVTRGTGDHTYEETHIVSEQTFNKYKDAQEE